MKQPKCYLEIEWQKRYKIYENSKNVFKYKKINNNEKDTQEKIDRQTFVCWKTEKLKLKRGMHLEHPFEIHDFKCFEWQNKNSIQFESIIIKESNAIKVK